MRAGHVGPAGPRTVDPIFVIAQPRTGSGLMNDLLDGLDGVAMGRERLHPHRHWGTPGRVFRLAPLRHLEWSLASLPAPRRGVVIHTIQLDRTGLTLDDLDRRWPGARYVVTYRRSLGDMYASRRVASMTGAWTLLPGQERAGRPLIQVNRALMAAEIETYRRAFTATLTHPVIRAKGIGVAFEDLAADPARLLRETVLDHLGLEADELPRPRLRRQRDYDIPDIVVDHDAVADLFAATYDPPAAAPI